MPSEELLLETCHLRNRSAHAERAALLNRYPCRHSIRKGAKLAAPKNCYFKPPLLIGTAIHSRRSTSPDSTIR